MCVSFVNFESFRMQFSTSSVPFGLSLIFPHKSRAKIATHDAWPPPLSRYSYYSVPLIIEGGAYNLCWCGPPARTWNIAPGRWNRVERQWLVWQVIGVAQVIKNGVLMGSSHYESLMFATSLLYILYIYIYIRSDSFLEPDTGHVPRVCMAMSS